MELDPRMVMMSGMGVVMGIYWFFAGFRDLKSSRAIQDIPTSKIATGAVGTDVEVNGVIMCDREKWHTAPITGKACVFYSVEIQKLVKRKNSSHWVKIDELFSDKAFYLDDGSGALALVMIRGADIRKKKYRVPRFRLNSNNLSEMPDSLMRVLTLRADELKNFKMQESSWWNQKQYRFLEWSLAPEEKIYVLGYAESGLKAVSRRKPKFKAFMEAKKVLEAQPQEHARFDQDRDGKLDPEELERGAAILAEELESKYSKEQVDERQARTKLVFKKKKDSHFFISNMPEKDLIKKLTFKATLKLWGGPVVAVAGAGSLLYMFT